MYLVFAIICNKFDGKYEHGRKIFSSIPEFRILRLTFFAKSASKC